ncbi:MAG: LacI family DNA-binding transcriptional regulator [Paracoccaceae bacterium]
MNLKELSQKLGLSQTTVSRALNGYPEVSERTRLRVQRAADQHSYSPNTRAKGLATGQSMMVGHVFPPSHQHEMVNPVFGDFVAGASQALAGVGYGMMFTRVRAEAEESDYKKLQSTGAVDGVVLHAPSVADPRVPLLRKLGLPFVVHGRASGIETPYSWVDVNNKRAFMRATEFLIQLGHRRIALLNGLEHLDFATRRRTGYLDALAQAGIAADHAMITSHKMTESYGYEVMHQLLKGPQPPTAVLVSSLISALGVRRAIEELGLVMGRDVSVITHDDELSYLPNGGDVPIFTATRSSVRRAGEAVAEFLIAQISDASGAPPTRLLEAELILGRSTGPAP